MPSQPHLRVGLREGAHLISEITASWVDQRGSNQDEQMNEAKIPIILSTSLGKKYQCTYVIDLLKAFPPGSYMWKMKVSCWQDLVEGRG